MVDHIEAEVARLPALEQHLMCEIGPEADRLQARARGQAVGLPILLKGPAS